MNSILPMVDDIKLFKSGGYDDWGQLIVDDPIVVKGNYHYNSTRETVVGNDGDEVVFTANIYFPVATEINYETTVFFEDLYGNRVEKKPIRIQPKRDAWGIPLILRVVV